MKIYEKNNPPERIREIAATLEDGGVIIFPTGTTYALGCHALKERAVEKVYRLKGVQPEKQQLSIICYDLSEVSKYAKINNSVFRTIKRNTPGAFTFILPALNKLPKVFHRLKGQVGVRMPEHPALPDILAAIDAPLLTASLPVDEEARENVLDPELVAEAFRDKVDLILDGGYGVWGQSTIVDCTDEEAVILRQGDGELI